MLEWNPRLLMMELVTSSFVCSGHYILVRLKKKPKSYVKNINWEKKMLEVKEEDTHNASDAIIIITMKRHLFWTTFFILILIFSSSPRLASLLLLLTREWKRMNYYFSWRTETTFECMKELFCVWNRAKPYSTQKDNLLEEKRGCYHQMRNE